MTQAFDLKDLEAKLLANGMPVVEGLAKLVIEQVLDWVSESVTMTENKYDDFTLAIIPIIKPMIIAEIAKIDGKV